MMEEMEVLLGALGWHPIPSRNPYMVSFRKADLEDFTRMNIYFTTMTVTIQTENRGMKTWKGVDLSQLETIAIEN